jgi:methyl-accepting chemotaxis protein
MVVDHWTIGRRLYTGCGALLALTVLAGGVAIWGASRIKGDVDIVTRRAAGLEHAMSVQTSLFKIESREKTLLWAGLDNDRALYDSSKAAVAAEYESAQRQVDELTTLVESETDRTVAAKLRDLLNEWKTVHGQVVALSDGGRFAEAQQLINERANPVVRAAEDNARGMVKRHHDAMTAASAESAKSYSSAQWLIAIVVTVAGVFCVGVVWLVRHVNSSLRVVSFELRDGAQLVVDASSQMSVSAQSMSQGAAQQAASLEETSASMEEMAGMTRRNAENSHQAAALMAEAAKVVGNANRALEDMVSSMTSIKDSSNRVSKIIKTIDEIAFQTNILALNAAVEAARAGEAGMGFAVVADEVRSLAQRSAQAAKDTAGLIEAALSSSSEGSQKVEQVASGFGAITASVTEVKALVDEVSGASKQQALGIEQVTQAIRQMERVTQTTAATAEESAAACEQLNTQADVTMQLVGRLETMVGGANGNGHRKHAETAAARGNGRGRSAHPLTGRAKVPEGALAESGTFGSF